MELIFDRINKNFGDNHVLKDVSFNVSSGQIFGYLGRNGAGKTTSIRILMDVFKPDSGNITIDGKTFIPDDYKIGYLPEERGMYAKTKVFDQLVYFAMLRKATRKEAEASVKHWAKRFGIEEYLNRTLETLSKGNQQKVQITQAFLNEPDILILDEPFSGLDPVNSQVFQDALTDYISDDKIIIFSSHQMAYVETFCDDIALINHGEIVLKGSLSQIKRELGNNKVKLVVDIDKAQTIGDVFVSMGYQVDMDEEEIILSTTDKANKHEVMKILVEKNIDVRAVMDYEPSLQEIFVNSVGGKA